MRKQFDEWYRVRANLTNEGLGDWAQKNLPWSATNRFNRAQKTNDPRAPQNLPRRLQDLEDNAKQTEYGCKICGDGWWTLVEGFGNAIGITGVVRGHPLYQYISNIAAARYYGPAMGLIVQVTDLRPVWNAMTQKSGRKGQSIAEKMGIHSPLEIPIRLPHVTNAMKWQYSQESLDFDKEVRQSNRPQQGVGAGGKRPGDSADISGIDGDGTPTIIDPAIKRRINLLLTNEKINGTETAWDLIVRAAPALGFNMKRKSPAGLSPDDYIQYISKIVVRNRKSAVKVLKTHEVKFLRDLVQVVHKLSN